MEGLANGPPDAIARLFNRARSGLSEKNQYCENGQARYACEETLHSFYDEPAISSALEGRNFPGASNPETIYGAL